MALRGARTRWAGLDAHRPGPWREPTRCIFCGVEGSETPEGKLTQEHVYSDWTRRFVPRTMKKYRSLRAIQRPDHSSFMHVKQPGDIRDWQVRCVCACCNNGWMRKLDNLARPIMIPLIQGKKIRLHAQEQTVLAAWAAMKAMVAEYGNSEIVTTHHAQRQRMKRIQLPPEGRWGIWIGRYIRERWPSHWVSQHFLILPKDNPALGLDRKATYYNSHATTQVVGQLFIHIIRTPMPDFIHRWRFHIPCGTVLFRIWPPTGYSIAWPGGTMDDRVADHVADAAREFFMRVAVAPNG